MDLEMVSNNDGGVSSFTILWSDPKINDSFAEPGGLMTTTMEGRWICEEQVVEGDRQTPEW